GRLAVGASLVVVLVIGIGRTTGAWPRPWHPVAYVEQVRSALADGLHGWLNVTLPFEASRYAEIRAVVLLATLGVLCVAAYGLLAALLPFATSSIVYQLGHPLLRGLLFLAFALVLFAGGDRAGLADRVLPRHALALGATVLALAAVAASLPGVARGSLLPWRD